MIDSSFTKDVDKGLSSSPKYLSSKYFYDDKGSDLFRQIMEMPEYYLTDAEFEIFDKKSNEILAAIGVDEFNIIELGAGDGFKTKEFLKAAEAKRLKTRFYPIDISAEALYQLKENLKDDYPESKLEAHVGDYFIEMEKVFSSDVREVVLFLGSNIGNYDLDKAIELLSMIGNKIKSGDLLLLGVDLKKNPNLIARAYNDSGGITRAFNLNLLDRINNELMGDFITDQFDFYSSYNPETGAVKSYLVSLIDQEVTIEAINKKIQFNKDELIYTELSKKYSIEEIRTMAEKSGFKMIDQILDSNNYFAECILEKA